MTFTAMSERNSEINLVKDSRLLIEDLKMERVIMNTRLVLTTVPMTADIHIKKWNLSVAHMKGKRDAWQI